MYDSAALDTELRQLLPAALRLVFTGPSGSGKSTVLASVPVPKGTQRFVLDYEDGMAYLDGGDTPDVYLPRSQRFTMKRWKFPKLEDLAEVYTQVKAGDKTVGALVLDNIGLLQEQISDVFMTGDPAKIRALLTLFDVGKYMPFEKTVVKWKQQRDVSFWETLKLIPKRLVLTCIKQGIHLVVSTEEGNLWKNFGEPDAKVIGKKANGLRTWMQFTDAVIHLTRDPNRAGAPIGNINLKQPKMRIQGMNPSWLMDWSGFVAELGKAKKRTTQEIPDAAKVSAEVVSEAGVSDDAPVPAIVAPPAPAAIVTTATDEDWLVLHNQLNAMLKGGKLINKTWAASQWRVWKEQGDFEKARAGIAELAAQGETK